MKLKDNFYTIISSDKDQRVFDIQFNPDNVIFKAHFPGMPVTPGVCIIQIATELLAELLTAPVELQVVSNAKYLSVINPTETPGVTYAFKKIEYLEDARTVKVTAVVTHNAVTYAKLSLVYNKK